jgi:hypothetical protein
MSETKQEVDLIEGLFVFKCPHCLCYTQIEPIYLSCLIFRHAYYKNSNMQIGAHTNQEDCERLVQDNLVSGCAKPFKFFRGNPNYVDICGYV